MSESLFTDEDVSAAAALAMDKFGWYFYPDEMREFLSAVLPAIKARWERDAPCHCESCWLEAYERRKAAALDGGGFPESVYPATPGAANVALDGGGDDE